MEGLGEDGGRFRGEKQKREEKRERTISAKDLEDTSNIGRSDAFVSLLGQEFSLGGGGVITVIANYMNKFMEMANG